MTDIAGHESNISSTSVVTHYRQTLRDMFGVPIEVYEEPSEFSSYRGVEALSASPTTPFDLFPDGQGSVDVYLPMPGEDKPQYPCLTVGESTEAHYKSTSIVPDGDVLKIQTKSMSHRAYEARNGSRPYVPLERPVHTLRELSPEESATLLDWVGTLVPAPRPRPVSLVHVATFSQQTDEFGLLAHNDAEKLELAIEQVALADTTENDAFSLRMLNLHPSDQAREVTGAQAIEIFTQPPAVEREGSAPETPVDHRTTVYLSRYTYGGIDAGPDALEVYPEDGALWMQRGPKAIPAEKYHFAIGGQILMSGMTTPQYGLPPIKLNPLQADGFVAMLLDSTPRTDRFPVAKRWDEL